MKRINLNKDVRPLSEFRANGASMEEQFHETRQEVNIAEKEILEGKGISHSAAKKMVFEALKK